MKLLNASISFIPPTWCVFCARRAAARALFPLRLDARAENKTHLMRPVLTIHGLALSSCHLLFGSSKSSIPLRRAVLHGQAGGSPGRFGEISSRNALRDHVSPLV